MIYYYVEEYKEVIEELKPLVHQHSSEIDRYQEYFTLDPAYHLYEELDNNEQLLITTARTEDGELVGYLVFFLDYHLHYQDILYAKNDLIFIKPEYRMKGIITGLFDYTEEILKAAGVKVITFAMKTDHSFEYLAEKMGYDKAEIFYSKYIGEDK